MHDDALLQLLREVASGNLAPEKALSRLRAAPSMSNAAGISPELGQESHTGLAEVVFAPGKNVEQLCAAVSALQRSRQPALATRVSPRQGKGLAATFAGGEYWQEAGLFALGGWALRSSKAPLPTGECIIVTAGEADLPVALEALGTSRFLGVDPGLITDVGTAGLQRIEPHLHALTKARLLIACAGMEGALPSVLAGLTGRPVIAVPTSIGYGASFQGMAALLTMLNACAQGVAVVNIDNGFGAAIMAHKLLEIYEQ